MPFICWQVSQLVFLTSCRCQVIYLCSLMSLRPFLDMEDQMTSSAISSCVVGSSVLASSFVGLFLMLSVVIIVFVAVVAVESVTSSFAADINCWLLVLWLCCVLRLGPILTWTGGNLPRLLIPDPAQTWWPSRHSWSSRDPGCCLYKIIVCQLPLCSGSHLVLENHPRTPMKIFLSSPSSSFWMSHFWYIYSGALVLPTQLSTLVWMPDAIDSPFIGLIFIFI